MEPIRARLSAQVQVPGLAGLALGYGAFRWPEGICLVMAREDQHVSLYDLRGPVDGAGPVARIAATVPAGRVAAPSPDGSYVVVCDQQELRAVDADGTVRWRLEHPCWGCADTIDHGSEPPCGGIDGGSAYVSSDSALVWAHVVAPWDEDAETGERLLVLDAATGTIVGSAGLGVGTAGSGLLLHPDGHQAVLSIGYGQDGAVCYLARWDGAQLTLTEFEDMDRIAVDIDPGGRLVLTTPHSGADLALYQMSDLACTVRLAAADVAHDQGVTTGWDYVAGFVDGGTIVAVLDTHGADDVSTHWLLDCERGPIGPVAYPAGAASGMTGLVGLGDGAWATIDAAGLLCLWRLGSVGSSRR